MPTWSASRVTKSEGKNFDTGMFTHSSGNPELEKVLERKMMENLDAGFHRMELSSMNPRAREAGQKCVQIKGAPKSNILLVFGK